MDLEKNLLLLKGQDQTAGIEYCNCSEGKWYIKFKKGPTEYEYAYVSVQWFKDPTEIDLCHYQLYQEGKQLPNITRALVFEYHIRVFWGNGKHRLLEKKMIQVRKSCLMDRLSHNHLRYFAEVADAMSLRSEDGTGLLTKQYEKLTFVNEKTVLATYLNPEKYPVRELTYNDLIVPFGCNISQKQAIRNALTDSVSIIQGPPGTGKTQTILNVIANILLQGKTVAIVSNNNAATQNILEKMQRYQLKGIVATLGNKENKQSFIKRQHEDALSFVVLTDEAVDQCKLRIIQLHEELEEMLQKRNTLAEQKTSIDQFVVEKKHFEIYFEETYGSQFALKIKSKYKGEDLLKLWHRAEQKPLNLIARLWFIYIKGIGDRQFYKLPIDQMIASIQRAYYEMRHQELVKAYEKLKIQLEHFNFEEKQKELEVLSMNLLYDKLGRCYNNKNRPIFDLEDLWKNEAVVNREYPVILSTTHSIRGSLGYDYVYDYMIVDEASQVDLATGVLAMACAHAMIVVGDEKQLPNVVPTARKQTVAQIGERYMLGEGYQYDKFSLLTSIMSIIPNIKMTLLREHYRCHPKIIQFCNQKFYHSQLVIMTEDQGEEDVLKVYQTVPGNHARGHFNQRQLDEIKMRVIPELGKKKADESLGIITPYKEQRAKMEQDVDDQTIVIDTVHKFQGREKEDIIIVTVDNEITDFVDDPNMLNVAVSRAQKRLRLVVAEQEKNRDTNIGDLIRYITYNNGEILEGDIYSVFDLLYKEYEKQRKAYLKGKKQVSVELSENLAYVLLEELLGMEEFLDLDLVVHQPLKMLIKNMEKLDDKESAYVMNRGTHTDFVLFRKVDRSPITVIEVDGYGFHKEGTIQHHRDLMKDSILDKYDIPYIRLRTNESCEKERVIKHLRSIKK